MSLTASVANGLSGAVLLARGRVDGLARVQGDAADPAAGATRSFWAAAIAAPALLAMRLIDWTAGGPPAAPGHVLALDLLVFVTGWAGFAIISHALVARLGRAQRWPAYIAAWNWCNVVQYMLLLIASLPVLLHAPAPVAEATELIGMGWALWLEWFVTRLALNLPGLAAAGLVLLDLSIGLLLASAAGI